jgi:MFS transporter, SP family, solute carrier family 2 (myo-inositol transporter), member 13
MPADPILKATGNSRYNVFLLLVAGLGGLLYGVDVGIIAGALPYLEATSGLNAGQLSFIVAAVLLGSVISTLFAGILADWMGRKRLMIASGILFVASIPVIALSHGYGYLVLGRLLQGVSAGLIGVVVPLYLAECLGASSRGKGTGIFQWLLTLGIVVAAVIGMYFSIRVAEVARLGDAARLMAFKDTAWRSIFWVSLPPGVLFVAGSLVVAESPRWLHRKGRIEAARAALLRSRSAEGAELEMAEMGRAADAERAHGAAGRPRESLLSRRYVIPFVLACVILACNQATGVNSIIGYNTNILLQAGLSDVQAHWGYVILTLVNFLLTIVGVLLVDRRGRKFLLSAGSAGIIVSLVGVGLIFRSTERMRVDCREAVQACVLPGERLNLAFDRAAASRLLGASGEAGGAIAGRPATLIVIYSYGDFRAATSVVRSDDRVRPSGGDLKRLLRPAKPGRRLLLEPVRRPRHGAHRPPSDRERARHAGAERAQRLAHGGLHLQLHGVLCAGPGVCVWLALSELMPTRIRSNGMSIALLVNQAVSTSIAATFLPTVGRYGYSTLFFAFAGCTVVYFVTAAFFLPETKGKTLEEIEELFEHR